MTLPKSCVSRRKFIGNIATLLAVSSVPCPSQDAVRSREQIIDIHQHTHYSGRTNEQLIAHQEAMGVTMTILLPAGRLYGLDADCWGNDSVLALSKQRPGEFRFFSNEIPDIPEARAEITKYLKQGAIGIGEQKFRVRCDSPAFHLIAEIAEEFKVPILMHFWEGDYNAGIDQFHKTLEKFPKVNFIGHAQSWWGNVDAKHNQKVLYPTGKVAPGGITDRLLLDYPNMHGDLSAGSGLNALTRDDEHTSAFLERHQDKLMFGSDCNDTIGRGKGCQGAQILEAVRRLAPTKAIISKLLYGNAARLFKIEEKPV